MRKEKNRRKNKKEQTEFESVLNEIESSHKQLTFLKSGVRSSIVFMISFLVVSTIGFYWWLSLIPFIIYFIIYHHYQSKKNPYMVLEGKYPKMKDLLTTSRDNLNEENVFVKDIHEDAKNILKDINNSSVIDSQRLKKDITFLAILTLIIIIIAPFNPILTSIKIDFDGLKLAGGYSIGGSGSGSGGSGAGGGGSDDIYGDKSIALLGNEELNIKLMFEDSQIDISNIKEPEKLQFRSTYPEEITAVSSGSFEENIPKEQQDVVKNYYKKIAEG